MAELLKKFTGDIPDEASEAAYRLAATQLSRSIRTRLEGQLNGQHNNQTREFFNHNPLGQSLLSEPVFNFVLASALEVLIPGETGQDQRRLIAYNLRVQAWQGLGDSFLEITGITALLAGELQSVVQNAERIAGARKSSATDEPSATGEQSA